MHGADLKNDLYLFVCYQCKTELFSLVATQLNVSNQFSSGFSVLYINICIAQDHSIKYNRLEVPWWFYVLLNYLNAK